MVAAAVDATSAPASPSEATASGAKYPLIVAGGALAGFRRAANVEARDTVCAPGGAPCWRRNPVRGRTRPRVVARLAPRSATRAPIAETPRWPRRASRSQAIGATRERRAPTRPSPRRRGKIRTRERRSPRETPPSPSFPPRSVPRFPRFPRRPSVRYPLGDPPRAIPGPRLGRTRTRRRRLRNRSNAAAAACRSAMSDPPSSCMTWCRSGTAAAGGLDANHAASSVSYARMRRS